MTTGTALPRWRDNLSAWSSWAFEPLLCLLLASAPFWLGTFQPLRRLAAMAAVGILLLLQALRGLSSSAGTRRWALALPAGAYMVWCGASVLTSVHRHVSIIGCYWVGACCLLGWLCAQDPGRRWGRLLAITIGAFGVSWFGVGTALAIGDPTARLFSTFYNPNCLAAFLVMTLPLTAAVVADAPHRWLKLICPAMAFFILVALLLTGSRGGFLALLVAGATLLLALIVRWRGNRAWRGGLLFGLLAAVVIVAVAGRPLVNRLRESHRLGGNSIRFRMLTWQGAWRMALAHPWVGVGQDAFAFAFPRYQVAGFTRMAHNTWLQTAGETGFPGALALVWLVIAGAAAASRTPGATGAALLAAILGVAAHNLVDYGLAIPANAVVFWALLGLVGGDEGAPRPSEGKAPAIALAVISLVIIFSAGRWARAAALYEHGKQRYGAGSFARAADDLRAAARLAPGDAVTATALGDALAAAGDGEAAVASYRRAHRLAPTYGRPLYRWGVYLALTGDPKQAEVRLRQALNEAPLHPGARLSLARLLESQGREQAALDEYQRLIQQHQSPAGQVQALEDLIDVSYGFAYLAVGRREAEDDCQTIMTLQQGLSIAEAYFSKRAVITRYEQAVGAVLTTPVAEARALLAELTSALTQADIQCGAEDAAEWIVRALRLCPDVENDLWELVPPELIEEARVRVDDETH